MSGERLLTAVLTAAAVLTLAGCSSLGTTVPTVSAQLPAQVELSSVPFFPQEKYQCGPAALATVLGAQGLTQTPDQLKSQVYLPGREGSLQPELMAAVRRAGQVAYPLQPQFNDLLREVAAGNPVLVLQNLGLSILPQWHYAVVVGYDLERQQLVLRSGTEKRRVTDMAVFINTWRRSGNWGLVVASPQQLPVTAQPARWLQATHALSAVAPAQADRAYDHAVSRWPARSELWLASGNAKYSLQQFSAAAARFRQGLALHPRDGVLWNNYAYSLSSLNCPLAAARAVSCAVKFAPDNADVNASYQQLAPAASQAALDPPTCPVVRCR